MRSRVVRVTQGVVLSLAAIALGAGCTTQVGIAASPSEVYVEVGETAAMNVVAVMDLGSPTAVTAPVEISSSDEAIAVVSGQAVTGVAEGAAVLTITDGVFTTTANVYVVAAGTRPTELVLTPASISCTPASDDTQLEAFAVLTSGEGEDVTDQASYGSSDNNIALVTGEGVVVCVGEGAAMITAQYLGVADTVNVTVGPAPPDEVRFSSLALTCEAGEIYQVQVLALWENGSTSDVSLSATYTSNNSSVAVASQGLVQCLSEGSATIAADYAGVTGSLSVNVEPVSADPNELVDLRITPSPINCTVPDTVGFAVIAEFGDGRTADVTSSTQTQYQSSNSTVAVLVQNQVMCVQQGQATIQATYAGLTASTTVNVQ